MNNRLTGLRSLRCVHGNQHRDTFEYKYLGLFVEVLYCITKGNIQQTIEIRQYIVDPILILVFQLDLFTLIMASTLISCVDINTRLILSLHTQKIFFYLYYKIIHLENAKHSLQDNPSPVLDKAAVFEPEDILRFARIYPWLPMLTPPPPLFLV